MVAWLRKSDGELASNVASARLAMSPQLIDEPDASDLMMNSLCGLKGARIVTDTHGH